MSKEELIEKEQAEKPAADKAGGLPKDPAVTPDKAVPGKEKKPSAAQLLKEIEVLKEELAQSKNDYFKAYADTENLKKRLQNEYATSVKYRAQELALDLLPSVDNLERALKEADPQDNLTIGVKMVYDQLLISLKKEGIEAIEALNQPFDPNLHHAVAASKVKNVKPGIVVEELVRGYMIKDRILRASLVKVSE